MKLRGASQITIKKDPQGQNIHRGDLIPPCGSQRSSSQRIRISELHGVGFRAQVNYGVFEPATAFSHLLFFSHLYASFSFVRLGEFEHGSQIQADQVSGRHCHHWRQLHSTFCILYHVRHPFRPLVRHGPYLPLETPPGIQPQWQSHHP